MLYLKSCEYCSRMEVSLIVYLFRTGNVIRRIVIFDLGRFFTRGATSTLWFLMRNPLIEGIVLCRCVFCVEKSRKTNRKRRNSIDRRKQVSKSSTWVKKIMNNRRQDELEEFDDAAVPLRFQKTRKENFLQTKSFSVVFYFFDFVESSAEKMK